MVSTGDSNSLNLGSIPSKTFFWEKNLKIIFLNNYTIGNCGLSINIIIDKINAIPDSAYLYLKALNKKNSSKNQGYVGYYIIS